MVKPIRLLPLLGPLALARAFPRSRNSSEADQRKWQSFGPPQAREELKEVGWAKGIELVKLARRDRQNFDCATWLHRARQMPVIEKAIETAALMLGSDRSLEATVWR